MTADVTQFPARKARGAGGAKGVHSEGRLKTPEHRASGADPTIAEQRRHLQDKLVDFTAKHRALDNQMDTAMSAVDGVRGKVKELRSAIRRAGFPMELFDIGYAKVKLKTKKSDLEAQERMRGLMWEAWSIPYGDQPDLFQGLPDAARAARYWFLEGQQAGMLGEPCAAPEGMPGENMSDFTKGWGEGQSSIARGMKMNAQDAAKAKLPVGEGVIRPDWEKWDAADHHAWSGEQQAAFLVWYNALDAEIAPQGVPAQVLARISYLDDLSEEPEEEEVEEAPAPRGEPVH